MKKKHEKVERQLKKDIDRDRGQLESCKLRLTEVHKESRIIAIKMKEKERKINMRQPLNPINHTPLQSSKSKLSNSSSRHIRARSKKSITGVRTSEARSEQVYSSMGSQGPVIKEKTYSQEK